MVLDFMNYFLAGLIEMEKTTARLEDRWILPASPTSQPTKPHTPHRKTTDPASVSTNPCNPIHALSAGI